MSATNIGARRALSSQTFTQGEVCPTRTGQLSACLFRHLGMRSLACGGHAHGVRRPGSEDTPAGSPGWQPRLAARTDSQVCGPAAYIDNPSWQLILKTQDGSPADSPWSATVAFSDTRSDKTPVGEKPAVQKRSTRQIGVRERSGFGHASPQNPVGEKSSVQKTTVANLTCATSRINVPPVRRMAPAALVLQYRPRGGPDDRGTRALGARHEESPGSTGHDAG